MSETQTEGGATGDAQALANQVVDGAQGLANSLVDLGEEGAKTVFTTVTSALDILSSVVKNLEGKVLGE